MKWQPEFVS